MTKLTHLIVIAVIFAACGTNDTAVTSTSAPAAEPVAPSELEEFNDRASEFAASFWEAWPNEAMIERFAEDIAFYDPTDGDFTIEGKAVFGPIEKNLLRFWAAAEPSVEEVFVSVDGAAYRVEYPAVVWPPWLDEPDQHPPVVFLYVIGFAGEQITRYELWMEDKTLQMLDMGCFAVDACPEALEIVDRYLEAWGSGSPELIAALYADDATFEDSVSGIDAQGPEQISSLFDLRFGPGTQTDVVAWYAQTNGYLEPAESSPDRGSTIAIGIHYRVLGVASEGASVEVVTTFELGTRRPDGFDLHPEGLITREDVFQVHETYAGAAD